MTYLSDTNLRAVLTVLVGRLGGEVHVTNEELYDAMMPATGTAETFHVEEADGGIRVSLRWSEHSDPA